MEESLMAYASRARDLSPAMHKATIIIADAINSNFETESSPTESWEGLHATTQKDRIKGGFNPSHPILVRDGNVKALATSVREYDSDEAQVGAPDGHKFAKYLNDGARGGNGAPRRRLDPP